MQNAASQRDQVFQNEKARQMAGANNLQQAYDSLARIGVDYGGQLPPAMRIPLIERTLGAFDVLTKDPQSFLDASWAS